MEYVPLQKELMELPVARELAAGVYGGMPIQLGWCNGHNTKLNCLEYHRDSELNLGSRDFILLVAKREDMEDGRLDTAKVQAFHCPAEMCIRDRQQVVRPGRHRLGWLYPAGVYGCGQVAFRPRQGRAGELHHPGLCLLYTSRCV